MTDKKRLNLAIVVLAVHVSMLIWSAHRHSPVVDETGHLPAGLSHWHLKRFDFYNVNPPLVRLVATLPAFLTNEQISFTGYQILPIDRPEFQLGLHWADDHPDRMMPVFRMARWACVPFSVLGAVICFLWAGDLYGSAAGLIALCLWCFSPNILAHASLMTPDAGATAVGLAACYVFWKWLQKNSRPVAVLAGLLLGLALLTKFTWLILILLWPASWLVWQLSRNRQNQDGHSPTADFGKIALCNSGWRQLLLVFIVAWCVLNNGYLWEDSFQPLGAFDFSSTALAGIEQGISDAETGNRFRGTILENVPFPGPRNFLQGIDHIKYEYEMGYRSYLRGKTKHGGWWYYYLYAMLVKMPIGTLVLLGISVCSFVVISVKRFARPRQTVAPLTTGPRLSDELFLLMPAVAVLTLVSCETGFNHHLRYVLPAFPFLFIFSSRSTLLLNSSHHISRSLPILSVMATMISSLSIYPHSLSYFNELSGGSINGWRHLDKSSTDWGQDLLLVKEWSDRHPEAMPLYVSSYGFVAPETLGIPSTTQLPVHIEAETNGVVNRNFIPKEWPPGWYVLSLTRMVDPEEGIHDFLSQEPSDLIAYSMRVYQVSEKNIPESAP